MRTNNQTGEVIMEKIDYFELANQANGIHLDMIMDVLGEGYSYDDVDWALLGRIVWNSEKALNKNERTFIKGMMGDKGDKQLRVIDGDFYYFGQECVLRMEKDDDMRMIVSGVIRGLLDCGFAGMLMDICKGSNAFDKIFEEGKKVIDKQD